MPIQSLLTPRRSLGLRAGALAAGVLAAASGAASADYNVETVAQGLNHAWGMAFLPDGASLLVTERPGTLSLIDIETGAREQINGLPEVDARNQGGLLDVAAHPEFASNGLIYLTWADRDEAGNTATVLGRARLDRAGSTLEGLERLHAAGPYVDAVGHYGSRIAFDDAGHVFFTTGDRQSKDFGPDHVSQDRTNDLGAVLRLTLDGDIPADNPFTDDPDASNAIWSYGHRNPQGLAFHPETGELWSNEHGERNGDEINVIQRGGNYGWPIATWGRDYRTGDAFAPTPPEVPETVDPVFWWEPDHPTGFPPSGLAFYDGDAFPQWQGDALMGNLAHRYIGRFAIDGHEVEKAGRLLDGHDWRIRDVAVGPADGYVYVLIDDTDMPLVRLTPTSD